MRQIIFLTMLSVMLLGSSHLTFAQGGGGEKLPAPAKPRPVLPGEAVPSRPPVPVAPAGPVRPTSSALVITTNVPDVAITLNGRKAGATDVNHSLFVDSLRPVSYTIRLAKPGYRGLEYTVKLRAGATETLNFELTPILQTLTIQSTPGESEVLIDEGSRGYTDASGALRLDLPIGVRRVTLRKLRFRDVQRAVALTEEKEANVAAELQLAVGILAVTANVADAMIEIAGIGRFKGAAEKIDCEPGTHQITVTRRLFHTATKQVSIAAGQSLNVSIDLEPDLGERGRLVLQAQKAYASGNYSSAIDSASQLLSVDPAHAQALKLTSQSFLMSNNFDSFSTYAVRAIEAGETIEIGLRHHHSEWGLGTNMHPIKLTVRKETIGIDPQVTEGVVCNLRQATQDDLQNLKTVEVAGNGKNEIYLRLIFTDQANPKKTASFKFADLESRFVRQTKSAGGLMGVTYEGQTMVSRSQAFALISGVSRFINGAKMTAGSTRATTLGSNVPDVILIPDAAVKSLESIIDSSIKAMGGPMPWSTIVQKGTYDWSLIKTGQTISGSFEEYVRTQQGFFHSFNHEGVGFFLREGFDGTTAWFQLAKEKPKRYEAASVESLKRSLSLFSLQTVDDFSKAFPTASVRGQGKLGERRVYVVDAPRVVEGRVDTFYFDSENGLLLRQDTSYQDPKDRSKTSITKVLFDSYADVDGRRVVTGWKQIAPSVVITVRILETKHDIPVDETRFKMPAK